MPVKKTTSGLMAKYGAKLDNAVKSHADDPVDFGFIPLPPGIRSGIAQLEECYFDVYKSGKNQGEYYFRASGVILEPASILYNKTDTPVAGLHTSIIEPCCDTTNTKGEGTSQEEHVQNILNEMKKLGASTEGATGADLEALAAALVEAAPCFRFSTSQGAKTDDYPDPKVWENWNGIKGLENYTPPAPVDGGATDGSATPPPPAAAPKGAKQPPPAKPPTKTTPAAPAAPPPPPEEPQTDDLAALAELADAQDDAAAARLSTLANEAGIDDATIAGTANWGEVVGLIEAAAGGGDAAAEGETAWEPEVGQVYGYKPTVVNPKTKKKAKAAKAVEIEITAVDKASEKVNGLNNVDRKTAYKGIPWSDLESA